MANTERSSCLRPAVVAALLVLAHASAVSARTDPSEIRRMAATDRSVAAGTQLRVWAVTVDNGLTSKRPDTAEAGWTEHGLSGFTVDSGLDAVSLTEGGTARQRVFFAATLGQTNVIRMLNFDNDSPVATTSLPDVGDTFSNTDVAAVTWNDGVQRVAVAAIATNGRVCIWEGVNWSFTTQPWCSASSIASTIRADIVGSVHMNSPAFFYRMSGADLGRATRTGLDSMGRPIYLHSGLSRPPGNSGLNPSLWVASSIAFAGFEIGLTTQNGKIWRAHVGLTGTAAFLELAALGAPLADERTAITGRRYWSGPGGDRLLFFVQGSSGTLYRLFTNAAGTWGGSWGAGVQPPDEEWRSCGVSAVRSDLINGDTPLVFGSVGRNALLLFASVLQEYDGVGFRDHIRSRTFPPSPLPQVLGAGFATPDETTTGTFQANESVVAVHPITSFATALRRDELPPWQVVIDDSFDGANDWGNDYLLANVAGGTSFTDPYAAVGPDGSFHHVALQLEVVPTMGNCTYSLAIPQRQLVYRRGTDALALANLNAPGPNLTIVSTDPGTANLDHPSMVVTGDGAVHFLYVSNGNKMRQISPAGVLGPETSPVGPGGIPTLLPGASGALYGADVSDPESPNVCLLPSGPCGQAPLAPTALSTKIYFGEPTSPFPLEDTNQNCLGGAGPAYYRCFEAKEPVAFEAHPTIANRIFIVWPSADAMGRALFFTRSESDLSSWIPPVRITPYSSTLYPVDPELSVGADGTLFVTYSLIENRDVTPAGEPKVAYSTDQGSNWTIVGSVAFNTWDPHGLGYHCIRDQYFLGEYRQGGRVGNRVYNTMPVTAGGRVVQSGMWSSRWSIY